MKNMLFILNPCAGTKKVNKMLPEILSVFIQAGYDVHIHITQARGDGKQTVKARAGAMDLVVCCGGDGTFNETVAGILEGEHKVPIGYIPAGSTNDFANSLKLSTEPVEAAKAIVAGTPESFDVGSFDGRYFTYVASFGAFTKASYSTPQNMKNALGHPAYLLSGLQELSQIHAHGVRIELEDEVLEGDYLFGAVCNSTSVGGILTLDPKQVDMADGKFELMLIRAPKDLAEIGECIQAVQKQQYNCGMITFRSTSRLRVYAAQPWDWTLDGERQEGRETIEIENKHQAILLMR